MTRTMTLDPNGGRDFPDGVSIAIPNWNHEVLLPRSIGSALRAVQTLHEHGVAAEVLVIDDGSRDGSLTLLRQLEALYANEGLRVLALARNSGLAVVRNLAFQSCRYRYLIQLDADNELVAPNVYHFYRSIRDTAAAVVYGNLIWYRLAPLQTTLKSNESFQTLMFDHNYIDACALYDRQQVIDVGGALVNEWRGVLEDWEMNLHLATNGRRLIFVPLVFGLYYELPESLVTTALRQPDTWHPRVTRMYDQLGGRATLPLNTRHLRYHPDIGYL